MIQFHQLSTSFYTIEKSLSLCYGTEKQNGQRWGGYVCLDRKVEYLSKLCILKQICISFEWTELSPYSFICIVKSLHARCLGLTGRLHVFKTCRAPVIWDVYLVIQCILITEVAPLQNYFVFKLCFLIQENVH